MRPFHFASIVLLWFFLPAQFAWAGTADEHFLLSSVHVERLHSVNAALSQIDFDDGPEPDQKGRKNGKLPVEAYIRSIEGKPQVLKAISRAGLTPREFGLASYALLHAALLLHVERNSDQRTRSTLLDGLTKEQKANVTLLRRLGPSAY
ncbi:hypothetical protein [Massilia sp. CF038]|uniref:hypothetical protein n=1 Tax=Massilia sp. CF038 TaxID=1881045 RepID=UPI0009124FFA|nr:hypothetical protein [Massilia sp. CF038]SHG61382.1 hypothetical protein SAMN05428948_1287 [Massilia sp. CF038]